MGSPSTGCLMAIVLNTKVLKNTPKEEKKIAGEGVNYTGWGLAKSLRSIEAATNR